MSKNEINSRKGTASLCCDCPFAKDGGCELFESPLEGKDAKKGGLTFGYRRCDACKADSTTRYTIEANAIFCEYDGLTAEDAIARYIADAGYSTVEDAADVCGQTVEEFLKDITTTEDEIVWPEAELWEMPEYQAE